MTISTAKRIWSDQELLALPKDGYDREIVNGDLVVSPAGSDHGAIIMSIAGPLYVYVAKKQLGQVLDGQTGCRMSNGDLLSPDISFVSAVAWNEHRKSNTTFYQGGPDLAVEVMSRDDSQKIIELKLAEYFADGTRLAWVVHPRKKSVTVYRSRSAAEILGAEDTLEGEGVVPGFSLKISTLFR